MKDVKRKILFCLTTFLSFAICMSAQKITLNFNHAKLSAVLNSITHQTDLSFTYSLPTIDPDRTVSITVSDMELAQALSLLFKDTDINYEIDNKKIFLVKKSDSMKTGPQQQEKRKIKGTVHDKKNEPVIGATIMERGTQNGVVSDIDGNFAIEVSPEAILSVSYIGLVSQEIPVENKNSFSIVLAEDQKMLEEVVVIGYGVQRKQDVTSSVSTLKASELAQGAVGSNPLQAAEGKIAGLTITRSNGNDPNANLSIQLRGVSSVNGVSGPLIVIDGVPGGDLSTLTPYDIESFDVLKDGSAAAIYGTRGTNGVILVTTKKGSKGTPRVNFEGVLFTETIDKKLDVLTAEEYRKYAADSKVAIQDEKNDTSWFDELVKTPLSQMYSIALSGGSDNTTYRASLSYKDQEGITKAPATRETINTRLSLSQKSWEGRLSFDVNIAYSNIKAKLTDYASFEQAIKRNPTEPVYNQDGTFFYPQGGYEFDFNPVARLENTINRLESNRMMGDFRSSLNILEGLETSIMLAMRKQTDLTSYYDSRLSENSEKSGISGVAKRTSDHYTDNTLEWTASYNKSIREHSFSVMGGYSYQDFDKEHFMAENKGFMTDVYETNNLASGTYLKSGLANMQSSKNSNKLIAFLGRGTYNYDNRYLLTASIRREGSSRFGKNHKWGTFPAASLGWRISSEPFMKDIRWVDDFKLRAGYGVTGNQMSSDYISIARMSGQEYILNGGKWVQSYGIASNANPYLKWETKHEYNLGFDFSILNNRLGMTFDYYQRKNNDLLYVVPAAVPSYVHNSLWANVGSMKSNGVEVVISGMPVKTKDFLLNASLNFSHNASRLESLTSSTFASGTKYIDFVSLPAPGMLGYVIRLEENEKVGNFYGYKYKGLTEEGKWIFDDVDNNGIYNDNDKQIIGNGVPKFFAGLSTNMSYKRFDLSLTFRGAFGFEILNVKEIYYANPHIFPNNNLMRSALEKHKNIKDIPQYSSYYLEKGDYVKLGNATLSYSVNTEKFSKYIENLRFYASADNLLTVTGYSGSDPEINSAGFETGVDARTYYPRTRTFTFGVNIGF